MCPNPRRRVRADLISFFILLFSIGALNAIIQMPPQLRLFAEAGEQEEEQEHEASFGADALRYQLMKLQDAYGRIPANAYARAKSQVDLLKWSGAARRVEQAPPVPVAPEMFAATAAASAAGASLITPQSWRWLGPGNVGGRIRSIVVHPTRPGTIFAGSVGGGIWKTTNGGAGWMPVDDFMPALSVSSLVFNPSNPNVMFAGTGEGYGNADSLRGAGIFKSADGGTTWTQLAQTATQFSAVTRLAISPSGAVILAGTNTGLWRSTNGTAFTWIDSGLTPQDVDFNPANNRRAIAAGYGAVAYSWDGGLTWQRSAGVPSGAGRIELAFARSQPDTIYALVDYDGGTLYRSGDGGASFRAVSADPLLDNNQGWYDEALWVNPRDSNHVVAGGVYLRQTFDGGASWQWINDGIHVDHHVIVEDPRYDDAGNRSVFFGNDGGVYRTADIRDVARAGYTALNNNLGVTQFYGAAGHADTGTIVGGTQDNGTLVNEPRQATRWEASLPGDGGFVASDPTDASYFYAGMIYLQVQRSTDGGRGWTSITDGIGDAFRNANFIAPIVLDPNDPSRMFAGGTRLWRSVNVKSAKPAWAPVTSGAGGNYISAIAVAPGQPQVVWIGHNLGHVYRSTNATAASPRFSAVKAPTSGNFVSRIAISPHDASVVYVATGSFGPRNVLKSVNGGATWSDATGSSTTGLPEAPVNDVEIDPVKPNTIYAGTEVGVFVSRDGGATWDLPQDGPANVSVDELFWMGTTLVAATHGRGVFAADSSGAAPPVVKFAPAALDFGSMSVLATSGGQRITVTNSGGLPLTIYSIALEATGDVSYSVASSSCSGTLGVGASCRLDVVFTPRAAGARAASIRLISNASNSEVAIPLHGVGVAPPAPNPLPAGWRSLDIGGVGKAGRATGSAGAFSIAAAGTDIWGTSDAFRLTYLPLNGDGEVVARVAMVQNVNAWTKAGIMIRQGTDARSAHASLFVTPAKGIAFQRRTAAGAVSTSSSIAGMAPRFVKLSRTGATITAFVSTDGAVWTTVGKQALTMSGPVLAGLAVTSHDNTALATAAFDRVAVSDAPALPAGWRNDDIGQVGRPGSVRTDGGVLTVRGAGADIWGTVDAFHFVHGAHVGDDEIVARVVSIGNTYRWAKAGVMIRQGEAANAPFAMMVVTPGAGVAFQYRKAAGADARTVAGRAATAPYWVKMVRRGKTMTGYQSADGTNWQRVGAVDLPVAASVEGGLVVTSHDATTLCTAVFDHLTP